MKKAKKYFGGIVFSICFILFLLLRRLPNNGDWYYYCNVILCSVVIVSGVALVVYSLKSSRHIKYEHMYYCISILITALLSFNLYIDLFTGKKETVNDQFNIVTKEFSINHPDSKNTIKIPYNGAYIELYITDQQWEYLINNNPLNNSKMVVDPITGDTHQPHMHPVKVIFYEKSKIISTIEIIE